MKRVELGKYVVSDPSICHGKLTFKGTRVLVEPVLAAFANGRTIDDMVTKDWPTITKEAVEEALMLAIHSLVKDYPGYPDQPWHDEVARQVEERERRLKERKQRGKKRRNVEVAFENEWAKWFGWVQSAFAITNDIFKTNNIWIGRLLVHFIIPYRVCN